MASNETKGRKGNKDGIEDPDPMMQALYGNILELEQVLLTLRRNVLNFVRAVNLFGAQMQSLATSINHFCGPDEALSQDTGEYCSAVDHIVGRDDESRRNLFISHLELRVIQPLNVNITVLSDIKQRMMEREALRKASQKRLSIRLLGKKQEDKVMMQQEFEKMTKELFEELSALFQHRFDFVRGPYQALKKCQFAFFSGSTEILENVVQAPAPRPATSADPLKAPPPKASKSATEIVKETGKVVNSKKFEEEQRARRKSFGDGLKQRSESMKRFLKREKQSEDAQPEPKPDEVIKAVPVDTGFNPDADRPAAGTAYMRLGRARGLDAIGTKLKLDEEDKVEPVKFLGASEVGSIRINIKGHESRRRRSLEDSNGEIPMKIAPNDEIPMKIAPSDEIPMKIAPSGEIPMKIAPSGEIPMKIAPSGEIPMKIAPSGEEIPMKIAPFDEEIPMKIAPFDGEVPMKMAPSGGEIPMKIAPSDGEIPMKIVPSDLQQMEPSPVALIKKAPEPGKYSRRKSIEKKKKKKKAKQKDEQLQDAIAAVSEFNEDADDLEFDDFVGFEGGTPKELETSEASPADAPKEQPIDVEGDTLTTKPLEESDKALKGTEKDTDMEFQTEAIAENIELE